MSKINLITPPDKLFNKNYSFLLIYPSKAVKEEFQTYLENLKQSLNVYLYELPDEEENLDWLLTLCKMSETVIFDVDNSTQRVRQLAAYIISNTNTYWLTNSADTVYNQVSINRVYNLDFLNDINIGDNFGKK